MNVDEYVQAKKNIGPNGYEDASFPPTQESLASKWVLLSEKQ